MMSKNEITFKRGNDRLAKMLADNPERARAVKAMRAEMDQEDRVHAMGLAAVRKAAQLTQTELAERLGIKQSAVSLMESREDVLLSTLASYLAAAGATDVAITARLGERTIEVALPTEP